MNESDISIFELRISARAKTSLWLHDIKNLADLRLFAPEELRQLPNIGVKSMEEIAAAIAAQERKQNE